MTTPTRAEAFRAFGRIGLLSFGGPAAQIALMHEELVDRRKWMTERGFLNALSFCMLLPGPEAMQLATYAGWRLHGTVGGLIAGLLFVLPGAAVISWVGAWTGIRIKPRQRRARKFASVGRLGGFIAGKDPMWARQSPGAGRRFWDR